MKIKLTEALELRKKLIAKIEKLKAENPGPVIDECSRLFNQLSDIEKTLQLVNYQVEIEIGDQHG